MLPPIALVNGARRWARAAPGCGRGGVRVGDGGWRAGGQLGPVAFVGCRAQEAERAAIAARPRQ
ncbi:MAG: hypothetical protein U0841_04325 [Chloroflexia bacterium]